MPTSPKRNKKPRWRAANAEKLKALWLDGLSASQIAVELGDGISRNAVIGKIHRLGLGKDLSPEQRSQRQSARLQSAHQRVGVGRPKRPRKAHANELVPFEAMPLAELTPPDPQFMCTLDDLGPALASDPTKMKCRAPIGDPLTEAFRFCGTPGSVLPGPYCAFHHRMFYQAGTAIGDRDRRREADKFQAVAA